jgi:dolichol-phosphate mannosyltransferase
MKSISVILPAYEEGENLTYFLPKLIKTLETMQYNFEILVIDTQKPNDNTPEICLEFGVKYFPRKGGDNYGDAIRTGIEIAKNDITICMDCDGSHDPEVIPQLIEKYMDGADLVIGSRYIKDGKSDNGIISKFMSYIVNVSYRVVFGIKLKDISNSFRVYTTSNLKELSLECSNFDIVEEILILLINRNPEINIAEFPVYFHKRENGESKRNLFKFILTYIGTMRRLVRIKRISQKAQKRRLACKGTNKDVHV